ncbi:MAG: TIR domain-containing protein [Verrucomicrobia bacterium]|nr:TIR domain-containing protein [Verrucomicrobiota bacterium]
MSDLSPLADNPGLSMINADFCQLSDLPKALIFGETLEILSLYKTTLSTIPAEVLSEGEWSNCMLRLRAHLNDLEVGAETVREAKLVALGNGRVGKTQICRRLRGLPYDETILSTHGITVTSEPWEGSKKKSELLNIWDFGGQDIYHGAHTLFMETRSIFLIAWHPEFEEAREYEHEGLVFRNYPLSYWLEYVRTLGGPDSPVIVVQTQCDRPEEEVQQLPVEQAYLKFPFLKPCWYSADKNRGRAALNEAISDGIEFLRARDGVASVGKGRMRVLRALEKWKNADQKLDKSERKHRTLSQEEFRGLCSKAKGVSSPESLLEYLHNLGVIFYRKDLFHDRIILDQSWALDAVYAVFDRKQSYPHILGQNGRFTRSLLEMMVWREYSEREQQLFLSLMQTCGICFVYRKENKRLGLETEYIAPDLLPEKASVQDQLAGRWDDEGKTLTLQHQYEFLHPGLMRCLISDAGKHAGEAGVYWKYGVWVYERDTGCRAMIEQKMHDDRRGQVTASIQGRNCERLAKWIRETIEKRNRLFGYPNLKPVVDEFPKSMEDAERITGRKEMPVPETAAGKKPAEIGKRKGEEGLLESPPVFSKPPPSSFPKKGKEIFVSYAWGDTTPDGMKRGVLVENLCTAMKERGVEILRDRDQLKPGDRINEFMDRLSESNLIITIISDKYLRSEYCMYELFKIYRNCSDNPDRFLKKVIPLVLPDANVNTTSGRFSYAKYWLKEKKSLEQQFGEDWEIVGETVLKKYKVMSEFARNASDILEHLCDVLMPRDFDRMAKEGFQEVLNLIGIRPSDGPKE